MKCDHVSEVMSTVAGIQVIIVMIDGILKIFLF